MNITQQTKRTNIHVKVYLLKYFIEKYGIYTHKYIYIYGQNTFFSPLPVHWLNQWLNANDVLKSVG